MTDLAPIALWPPSLRQKLEDMRTDLLARMERRGSVEPAHLPMLAGIDAALAALDRGARTIAAAPAGVDGTGEAIRLVMYRNGDAIAAAPLSPAAAITLAGKLLGEAGLRLADDLAELRRKASDEAPAKAAAGRAGAR